MSVNKGSSSSSSTQALNPNNDALVANANNAQNIRAQPVTPYSGPLGATMDTSASQGALGGLLGYNAPTVSTAQNVSTDQINHYMDPYLDQVVGATNDDINHQMQQALAAVKFDPAWGGGSRDAVYKSGIAGDYGRTAATTDANLRSTGFNNAVGYGQTDLARLLSADISNQGASISSAGVRSGAATGLAGILGAQAQNDASNNNLTYQEWLRQQNAPAANQQLVNQAYGLLYNGPLTTQTGSGSTFGFGIPGSPTSAKGG